MALVSDADIGTLVETYLADKPYLEKFDRYHQGNHDAPFIPRHANEEYKLITSRSYTNFMRQAVAIPTQTLYVDGFRTSASDSEPAQILNGPEWAAWQRSRMDMIQGAVYAGAFVFGYALVAASRDPKTGKSRMRGISALKSSAIFDDPANDIAPRAAIEFISEPYSQRNPSGAVVSFPGKARVWGDTHEEIIEWTWVAGQNKLKTFTRVSARPHGARRCPVTRFAASLDLEGRCVGIVEPLIHLQDRINQSVHDLLIAQVYTSFQVRTATGMSGVVKQEYVFEKDSKGDIVFDADGHPVILEQRDKIDENGQPVLAESNLNAATMLISEDKDTKFGVLPGAPLDGFIESINMSIKHFATLSATPPHYMMGSITNISADALSSAEMALKRKIDLFKVLFGESWERVVNVAAEIDGFTIDDEKLETMWRDMEGQNFAKMADALLKLKELNVPAQGLWSMLPGISASQINQWKTLIEEDPDEILASAMQKGAQAVRPDGAQPTDPNAEQKHANDGME